jgi:nicotinate phosphoribosyltransferase
MTKERTDPAVFRLPVEQMREGYYSDAYFNFTKQMLEGEPAAPNVLMQVFQKKQSVLGGIDEAIAILKLCAGKHLTDRGGWHSGWDSLEVHALHEGDRIVPWEPVMTIEGPYALFAHLETVYLGVMARRSLVMNNVRLVCEAARGKPILFMPARHDHWQVQTGDGMAAHVAGAVGVSTDAQASWWGGTGVGTVPHGMIAAFGGDTVAAARAFAAKFKDKMNVTVLVDFDNDCAGTAVAVADALGDDLWGVRLDTSEKLIDAGLQMEREKHAGFHTNDSPWAEHNLHGVCPPLVERVRRNLDATGHERVKIVVSGGFNPDKINRFEQAGVPVDAYGVGSSLLRGSNDFTADVVEVDGEPCAKVGRERILSDRLERVI